MVNGLLEKEKDYESVQDPFLSKVSGWKQESLKFREPYDRRWAENMRQVKGIWSDEELTRSKVRNRSKIYFRKTWAMIWRLLASFYQAFLKDPDNFEFTGRGAEDVFEKEKVLQFMAQYRIEKMVAEDNLFLQHLWGMRNIADLGWGCAKFCWEYRGKKDGPLFKLYPNEQVYPDLSAQTKSEMRYIILESYMTKDQLKEHGYQNIEKAQVGGIPSNPVRSVRYYNQNDPARDSGERNYPAPGMNRGDGLDGNANEMGRYRVQEVFWKEDGKFMQAVVNDEHAILQAPKKSQYDWFPVVMGLCLTEAHKLLGEGFPEALKGPQDSLNHIINARKDNIHLFMNRGTIVSRFGNVDIQSLINSRPGGVTLADNPDAVKERQMGDITQSAYVEASQDEGMMQDMSGVTDIKEGNARNEKATTAQINLGESNAKIELFLAIVGDTWFRDFYSMLGKMIQKFETDETVFRVANQRFQKRYKDLSSGVAVEDVDDFEADVVVKVGLSSMAKTQKVQNLLLAMDKANMSNQVMIGLLKSGAIPPNQAVRFFDSTKFVEEAMPELGIKDVEKYFFQVNGPPPEALGIQPGMDPGAVSSLLGTPGPSGAGGAALGA